MALTVVPLNVGRVKAASHGSGAWVAGAEESFAVGETLLAQLDEVDFGGEQPAAA